jgi:hypothetical protein
MAMPTNQAKIEYALSMVRGELQRAEAKHGLALSSPHEGSSVIREEFEELWEHVRADTGRTLGASEEAAQVAAMAIKYMINFDPRLSGPSSPEIYTQYKAVNDGSI